MAVYTKVTKNNLNNFLMNYDIGILKNFEEIAEGVENTNYKITTSKNIFILTIFEKRVSIKDLPFFMELMNYLNNKKYKCPKPIANLERKYISKINNKFCSIVSFIEGNWIKKIENTHCKQLGYNLAKLHVLTKDFKLKRNNSMGYKSWNNIFNNFNSKKINEYNDIYKVIYDELEFLNKNWPKKLPSGIIHADLFQDNVFFKNNKFTGVIDFYFACNDYYAYELAVCLNAWCFENDQSFNTTKARLILNEYQKEKPLNKEEKEYFPILSRGAAVRFLLTRLNDLIFHSTKNFVKPKDPNEYLKILHFHKCIKSINEYGFDN